MSSLGLVEVLVYINLRFMLGILFYVLGNQIFLIALIKLINFPTYLINVSLETN
jgi:hypothetical protein